MILNKGCIVFEVVATTNSAGAAWRRTWKAEWQTFCDHYEDSRKIAPKQ